MNKYFSVFCFFAISIFASCSNKEITETTPLPKPLFENIPTAKPLTFLLEEVSGIAASNTAPRHLWAIEDSGNPPQLYLVSYDGVVQKKVYVKGATNHGWEDMALSGTDIYIGDFGDNDEVRTEYAIYKFDEPKAEADTVYSFEKIRFSYNDGPHDADALLVDPATKDIYIITKRDIPSAVYKIPFPYAAAGLNIAEAAGKLNYSGVVGAALSPDATEVILKTYISLYHYPRGGKTIEKTLQTAPSVLPYQVEPQGEAIAFAADNSGFFTLSEKGLANAVNLYFYKRK